MIAQGGRGAIPTVRGHATELGAHLLLLTSLWAGVGLGPAGWLAGVVYAVALRLLLTRALRRARIRWLGPANRVTLARTVLVGGVTALVADDAATPTAVVVLVALSTVALVLDAVDGQVARRTRTTSAFGARFDMEVDAFLILVLSVYVAVSLGTWVLAVGALRYAFAAAGRVAHWLRAPLPPSLARRAVAASQGVVLVVASAGVLGRTVATGAVALALVALVWSFGRDIVWLWRHRDRRAGRAIG